MNEDGSLLQWCAVGTNVMKSLPFEDIEDLQFESLASPKKNAFFGK